MTTTNTTTANLSEKKQPHILLILFPAQGHLSPGLQFANRLITIGARVTLVTCISARRCIPKTNLLHDNLSIVTFSDGYDSGVKPFDDLVRYMAELKRLGSQALNQVIESSANEGIPFTRLVHTLLLPWAVEVARRHHLPSTFLWIQPATVLAIYYYYFNGYGDLINNCHDPSFVVELPGLPPLTCSDLPSFFTASNVYTSSLEFFREDIMNLCEETNPKVLVNSFGELEPHALTAIEKFNMIPIGPLVPTNLLDYKEPSSKEDYIEWLKSKPESSVAYVSFGSVVVLSSRQMKEMVRGLLGSRHLFLWVIRADQNWEEEELKDYIEELEIQGKIVPWCSQVEVLSNPSIGCFVTHCGWNSTMESMIAGVPVVAFPQSTDQGTNAKLIEDVVEK